MFPITAYVEAALELGATQAGRRLVRGRNSQVERRGAFGKTLRECEGELPPRWKKLAERGGFEPPIRLLAV
jgi:hypothetical protein